MLLNLKSINFDAGLNNVSGVIAFDLAGVPVDVVFNGILKIASKTAAAAIVPAIATAHAELKRTLPRKTRLAARPTKTQNAVTWQQAILKALEGGNLTNNELLDHTMRLRGVAKPDAKSRKVEMQRLIVAASTAKKQGLIQRIEENGIDKWKAVGGQSTEVDA